MRHFADIWRSVIDEAVKHTGRTTWTIWFGTICAAPA
jgi:hypothetical protein